MSPARASELDPAVIHQAIFEGAVDAFIELYNHYDSKLRYQLGKVAFRAGQRRDMEDLVQEVWSRLLNNDRRLLRYYDHERGLFGPFLHRIVHQQAWQVLHRGRRKSLGDDVQDELDELPDEEASAFTAQLIQGDLFRKLLDEADAQLSEHDRTLLREHHLQGRTLRSLAAELGVNELTLHKRNQRLKARLAELGNRLLADSPDAPTARSVEQRATTAVLMMMMLLHPWADDGGRVANEEPSPRPMLVG